MKFLIGLMLIAFLVSSSVPNFAEALMESDQERADRELAEALMESDQERADRELAEAQTYESTCKDVSKEVVIDGLQKKYVINQEKYESCINNYENQSSSSSDTKWFQGIVILAVIGIVGIIVVKLTKERRDNSQNYNTSDYSYTPTVRRGWTPNERRQVRIRQDGKCAHCGDPPPRWEYHHVDGNKSNKSMNNCEGLCPNCHEVETHEG
jgi:hypothetical protein